MSTSKLNPMWDEHRALQADTFSEDDIEEMTDFDAHYSKLKELYPNFDKLSDAVQQKLISDTQLEQSEMAELLGCSVNDLREADQFWNELSSQLRDKFFERLKARQLGTPDILIGNKACDLKSGDNLKVLQFSSCGASLDVVPELLLPGHVWNFDAANSKLAQMNAAGSIKIQVVPPDKDFQELQEYLDEQKAIFDNPEDARIHDEAVRDMLARGANPNVILAGYEIEEEPLIRKEIKDGEQ